MSLNQPAGARVARNPSLVAAFAGTFVALVGILPAAAQNEPAPPGEPADDVLRFKEDAGQGSLETATIHLEREDGALVDLVGAIHIGDPGYYDGLNESFPGYDAVLFELVGDPDDLKRPRSEGEDREQNPIRFFQVFLKNLLGLEFQIDGIDYSAENFVHADMTDSEFRGSMEERGESLQTIFERTLAAHIDHARDGDDSGGGLGALMGIMDPDVGLPTIKLALARALADFEPVIEKVESGDGTTIISGRNDTAAESAIEVLADGKRRIAVFYGAAHLPGIEQSLVDNHGFKRTGLTWDAAWEFRLPTAAGAESTDVPPVNPAPAPGGGGGGGGGEPAVPAANQEVK